MNLPKDKFCKEFSYNQKEEKAEVLKQLLGSMGTIGAGSVVTKDIPDWCIATGNPCKVLRKITENDKRKLYRNEEIDDEAWKNICECN